MAVINQDVGVLRSAVQMMDRQRHEKRQRVRRAIAAASLPIPPDLVEALCQINPSDARDVLRDHPGFSLWERRRSYETSFRVFERSVLDLILVIQDFKELARDGSIFERPREADLDEIKCKAQKELFAVTNAAHALVDQSRRLRNSINVPGYDEQRERCFGNDGLHELVIGLRRILHHIHMIEPRWHGTRSFDDAEFGGAFKLDRDEVLLLVYDPNNSFTAVKREKIGHYLTGAPERIELRRVFEEYSRRVSEFHTWFSAEVNAPALEKLRDYERCSREIANAGTRMWWKMMLGNWLNWPKPPNPHDHLHRYLTPEQIEEVYRLPMGSSEQFDKVIQLVDQDDACDDELRQLAHDLFRRAPL